MSDIGVYQFGDVSPIRWSGTIRGACRNFADFQHTWPYYEFDQRDTTLRMTDFPASPSRSVHCMIPVRPPVPTSPVMGEECVVSLGILPDGDYLRQTIFRLAAHRNCNLRCCTSLHTYNSHVIWDSVFIFTLLPRANQLL